MGRIGVNRRLLALVAATAVMATAALIEARQPPPAGGSGGHPASIHVAVGEDDDARSQVVHAFYEARSGRPAWTRGAGRVAARELLVRIAAAHEHGLCPMHYGMPWLRDALSAVPADGPHEVAALDVALTSAFAEYVMHMTQGIDALGDGRTPVQTGDVVAVLSELGDPRQTVDVLESLAPPHPEYRRLRDALAAYRAIFLRGGWPTLPDDMRLVPGDVAQAALLERLAARLRIAGALRRPAALPTSSYDGVLVEAIREFQARHGLVVDGIIGPATLGALNVPAAERVDQLAINLNRWRRLPHDLGARHVHVNIPAYRLRVIVNGHEQLQMKTVVGRPATPTPAFSDHIRYVAFNPYWNVPASIARNELIPQAHEDPAALESAGFEVVDGWAENAPVLDPRDVDWDQDRFGYRLRQRPGPRNALGLVKFMFPNTYSVYLHDTPARHLFGRHRRTLSHGCVRVEKPAALATALLGPDRSWTREQVEHAMARRTRQTVSLLEPVPVHLTYFTAWVEDGKVQFRSDIYGWDAGSRRALSCP